MKDKIIDKLFELRHKEDELTIAMNAIEETKAPLKEQMAKVQEEISDIKNLILNDMESQNIKTYVYGTNNLTYAVRKTLSIVDEAAVLWHFVNDKVLLKKASKTLGLKVADIKKNLVLTVLNKPLAKEYAESLAKVDGVHVEGTEMKETKYLTIKNI